MNLKTELDELFQKAIDEAFPGENVKVMISPSSIKQIINEIVK